MATYKGIAYDNTNVRNIIPSSSDIMQLLGGLQVDGAATITGATTIAGNLTVNGTTTTVNSQIVTADRFLHMNNDYMADAIEDGGMVFTVDPSANEATGNLVVTSTTIRKNSSAIASQFPADSIIQITSSEDEANNGLYQIHSVSQDGGNTTITIKDASSNAPDSTVSAFVKSALTANADDNSMKVRVVKIGVIKTDSTNSVFEIAFGSSAPLTYNDVLTAASSVTASAIAADDITAGNDAVNLTTTSGNITIDAQASDSDIIFKGTDGGVDVTFLTLDGSENTAVFGNNVTVGDDLTLLSDSAVLGFGLHTDVTLTHVADTALLLNSSRQLQFGDNGTYIHQSSDSNLEAVADGSIILDAPTIDLEDDGVILAFGADSDVTLTHQADQGLLLNDARALMFRSSSSLINSPGAGDIDIDCSAELQLKVGASFKILENSSEVFTIDTDRKVEIGKVTGEITAMTLREKELTIGSQFQAGETVIAGNVLRMHTDGKLLKAASSSGVEARVLGISLDGGGADDYIKVATVAGSIVTAKFSAAPGNNTAGLPVFLDTNTNDGTLTMTAPTGSGLQVIQVGFLVQSGDTSATTRRICLQVIDRGAVN